MRFKSKPKNGYVIYAVSGVNSVSFAIEHSKADIKGLLGFAVKRKSPSENEDYFMPNYKVFKEVIPTPKKNVLHSSQQFPIQSFIWDDFTTKEEREYTYSFFPVKGEPKNLEFGNPIPIKIKTEALYSKTNTHDVFFNRGVASSQAYALKFGNQRPDEIEDRKLRQEAFDWLSRNLDEALIKFIRNAKKGDTLLGCFYEFRFLPVLQEFAAATKRGVIVSIIYDAKVNEHTDAKGKVHESFPREENKRFIKKAKIPAKNLIKREANEGDIQHNKFIVRLKGAKKVPSEVWFGSTNLSPGGIYGQTNVGHWIRDENVATMFKSYWELLSDDPGMQPGDTQAKRRADNKVFKQSVADISADLQIKKLSDVPDGETCFFSPRPKINMLNTYSEILDAAEQTACITLAFGINPVFKNLLKDNTPNDQITFMLLEKKDAPKKKKNGATSANKETFVFINSKNNVYKAYGAFLRDPVYQWTKEVNTQIMKLNQHVKYVHSKFLLADPLSDKPVVVTGSANFSKDSTTSNDEDMVIIKGNLRVADIYFTEFMRIFFHYYFRSVFEEMKNKAEANGGQVDEESRIFLCPDDRWLEKYKPKTFKAKRIKVFSSMTGAVTL